MNQALQYPDSNPASIISQYDPLYCKAVGKLQCEYEVGAKKKNGKKWRRERLSTVLSLERQFPSLRKFLQLEGEEMEMKMRWKLEGNLEIFDRVFCCMATTRGLQRHYLQTTDHDQAKSLVGNEICS